MLLVASLALWHSTCAYGLGFSCQLKPGMLQSSVLVGVVTSKQGCRLMMPYAFQCHIDNPCAARVPGLCCQFPWDTAGRDPFTLLRHPEITHATEQQSTHSTTTAVVSGLQAPPRVLAWAPSLLEE